MLQAFAICGMLLLMVSIWFLTWHIQRKTKTEKRLERHTEQYRKAA